MRTAGMTTADSDIERRRAVFRRWLPSGLLGLATLLASASAAELMPTTAERAAVVVLVAGALLLQLWWARAVRGVAVPGPASSAYYALRWAIGFALTWLNGFFAFYVAAGYFDSNELLPGRRRRWIGPIACSVPLAAAQAGGPPFHDLGQWTVFAGLLLANNVLLTTAGHFAEQQEERSRARAATITELERTNNALQRALAENAALHAQLLVQAREAGVADERRRLAAEIHDTIAQGLAGIIAQLQVVANSPDPAAAHEHLDRAAELARHSLGEARRSVQNLAPMGLAHDGLPESLRKTVTQWRERTGVRAEFTLTGTARQLPVEISATLLRITQEALSNASKHASASRVGVTLSFMGDEVTLDVRDDGRGFDPLALPDRTGTAATATAEAATEAPTEDATEDATEDGAHADGSGFGLGGMRARAERIAGSLTVESEPGGGTAVSARVPLIRQPRCGAA